MDKKLNFVRKTLCSALNVAPEKLELINCGKVKNPSYGISNIKFLFKEEDKIYILDLVKYKNPIIYDIWYANPQKQMNNCLCPIHRKLKITLNNIFASVPIPLQGGEVERGSDDYSR